MNIILFFTCIPILLIWPVLYPPIASFTAIFFIKNKRVGYISLFLVFSAAIITSLISATIKPIADTQVYIESFQDINLFDFSKLDLDNNGFEPLYKIYEYILSLFIDDNQNLFLLITALIFNTLSTIGILRIGLRLNEPKLACIILAVCYSLVAPVLGVPLFLLRSSLALAILLVAISFYGEIQILFYLLAIVAFFIHFSTLLISGTIVLHSFWPDISEHIRHIGKKIFFISFSKTIVLKISLIIFIFGFLSVLISPSLMTAGLENLLKSFKLSGAMASGKALSFLETKNVENFIVFTNPVMIIHVLITLLCFLKLRTNLLVSSSTLDIDNSKNRQICHFMESLRVIGRLLLIIIVFTSPLNFFAYRMGFFNFLYFPLWLFNVPFLSLQTTTQKSSRYLVLFALASVCAYTFLWMPKRQGHEFAISVLNSYALDYNLAQVIEQFL